MTGRVPRPGTPGGPSRVIPAPGQESVWDYPRPPRLEPVAERVRVVIGGEVVADTTGAVRILETGGAPVYAIPRPDVRMERLQRSRRATVCEWKGLASYFTYRHARREVTDVAWSYERPNPGYEAIAGHVAFYAGMVDEAWVGDERATAQPGGFYGGWVTARVVGPFKGEPGSFGW